MPSVSKITSLNPNANSKKPRAILRQKTKQNTTETNKWQTKLSLFTKQLIILVTHNRQNASFATINITKREMVEKGTITIVTIVTSVLRTK